MITIIDVLKRFYPNTEWGCDENTYDGLHWADKNQTKPSEEEIQARITELQAEYDANEYQRQRAAAYPSWQDQLDKIYHEGIDAWKAEIQAIKTQYPKPDEA